MNWRSPIYFCALLPIVAAAPPAHAILALRLSDGTDSNVVTDNQAGDTDPDLGQLAYSGMIGPFAIDLTASSLPGRLQWDVPGLTSSSAGTLTIEVTETGFTSSPSPTEFETALTGRSAGTLVHRTCLDEANMPFACPTELGSTPPMQGEVNQFPEYLIPAPATPFSLASMVTVELPGPTSPPPSPQETVSAQVTPRVRFDDGGVHMCDSAFAGMKLEVGPSATVLNVTDGCFIGDNLNVSGDSIVSILGGEILDDVGGTGEAIYLSGGIVGPAPPRVFFAEPEDLVVLTDDGTPDGNLCDGEAVPFNIDPDEATFISCSCGDGIVGMDEKCDDGNRLAGDVCTPACRFAETDVDEDGEPNDTDNCILAPNPAQLDVDSDGFGNACDGDFNDDAFVGGPDFTIFLACFNQATGPGTGPADDPDCEESDLNGDAFVGGPDFTLFLNVFNGPPGPSGVADPLTALACGTGYEIAIILPCLTAIRRRRIATPRPLGGVSP